VQTLDGRAIAIDPGRHTFHFETADGSKADRQVLVTEGTQNQAVRVVLGSPRSVASTPPSASPAAPASADRAGSPWKTVGFVVGGAGIVGLAVGAVFGITALGDEGAAHCNASNQCIAEPLSHARSAALAADVGLVGGGVLLAGGTALVLLGPHGGSRKASARANLSPMLAPHAAGLSFGGAW
jgi:hypothetical protein